MAGKHIFVQGKVQGVSFRFHTREKAVSLNIRGWVRNLTDGQVEVLAFGDDKNINEFLSWLNVGPSSARVDQVKVKDVDQNFDGEDFQIRR